MAATSHRKLYRDVVGLCTPHRGSSLGTYLAGLLALLPRHRDALELSVPEFLALIADAFTTVAVPTTDTRWPVAEAGIGIADVAARLVRQIADLDDLAARGVLARPDRDLGVTGRSGERWFNFDPATFLECGVHGAFGGYALEESSRALRIDGAPSTPAHSGDMLARTIPIAAITWEDVHAVLHHGQTYT